MKKLLLILLAAAMLSFSGCSEQKENSSAAKDSASSSSQDISEAADGPAPTEAPTEAPVARNTNLLTGEPTLSEEAIGKRPVAVMVNNAAANLPQYGISDADIIFEIPVEGDVTRLMAMYGDYTKVPDVCSIRSCRYYYPMLSEGFDAAYLHWGKDETVAARVLNELGLDNLDGNYGTYGLFGRDQSRLDQGYDLEHTSVLYGPKIPQAFVENGYRTDLREDKKQPAFVFNTGSAPVDGEALSQFRLDFGADSGWGYISDFSYDSEKGIYFKTHNEDPHMDGNTGLQLSFKNVIVLQTPVGLLPNDNSGRREIDITGTNKSGYYISGGTVSPITWSKADAADPIKLYSLDGKELSINTGKTYIAVCSENSFKKS